METCNKELERRVLYEFVVNRKARDFFAGKLDISHFRYPACHDAYERATFWMRHKGECPSWPVLVNDHVLDCPEMRFLRSYKPEKSDRLKGKKDAEIAIKSLTDYRAIRILSKMLSETSKNIQKEGSDINEIMERAAEQLDAARVSGANQSSNLWHTGVQTNTDALLEQILDKSKPPLLPTGFQTFDSETGGLPRTGLVVLSAYTSSLKSAMANQLLLNFFFQSKQNVVKVSLEMSEKQEYNRLLCNVSGVPLAHMTKATFSEGEAHRIRYAHNKIKTFGEQNNCRLSVLSPNDTLTLRQILTRVHSYGYNVILVDYISLLKTSGDKQWMDLSDIAREAKMFATSNNCLVILLAQLDKDDNIRYSKAIAEHADNVWKWEINEDDRHSGEFDVRQTKGRDQQLTSIPCRVDFDTLRIADANKPTLVYTDDLEEIVRAAGARDNNGPWNPNEAEVYEDTYGNPYDKRNGQYLRDDPGYEGEHYVYIRCPRSSWDDERDDLNDYELELLRLEEPTEGNLNYPELLSDEKMFRAQKFGRKFLANEKANIAKRDEWIRNEAIRMDRRLNAAIRNYGIGGFERIPVPGRFGQITYEILPKSDPLLDAPVTSTEYDANVIDNLSPEKRDDLRARLLLGDGDTIPVSFESTVRKEPLDRESLHADTEPVPENREWKDRDSKGKKIKPAKAQKSGSKASPDTAKDNPRKSSDDSSDSDESDNEQPRVKESRAKSLKQPKAAKASKPAPGEIVYFETEDDDDDEDADYDDLDVAYEPVKPSKHSETKDKPEQRKHASPPKKKVPAWEDDDDDDDDDLDPPPPSKKKASDKGEKSSDAKSPAKPAASAEGDKATAKASSTGSVFGVSMDDDEFMNSIDWEAEINALEEISKERERERRRQLFDEDAGPELSDDEMPDGPESGKDIDDDVPLMHAKSKKYISAIDTQSEVWKEHKRKQEIYRLQALGLPVPSSLRRRPLPPPPPPKSTKPTKRR